MSNEDKSIIFGDDWCNKHGYNKENLPSLEDIKKPTFYMDCERPSYECSICEDGDDYFLLIPTGKNLKAICRDCLYFSFKAAFDNDEIRFSGNVFKSPKRLDFSYTTLLDRQEALKFVSSYEYSEEEIETINKAFKSR